jgi:hypothetical protein
MVKVVVMLAMAAAMVVLVPTAQIHSTVAEVPAAMQATVAMEATVTVRDRLPWPAVPAPAVVVVAAPGDLVVV